MKRRCTPESIGSRPRAAVARPLLVAALALILAAGAGAAPQVKVLGLFKDKAIVEIDGQQEVLTTSKPGKSGARLLSATSEEAVIEIDGVEQRYRLGQHIGTQFKEAGPSASVRIYPDGTGMYLANGSINGFPVRFLVDTGATNVAMNRNEAKRLGLDYRVDGRPGITQTASGVAKTYSVTLKRVTVGDVTLTDVAATVVDGDYPLDVLLGNSFLGRLAMVRDGRVMELRKP